MDRLYLQLPDILPAPIPELNRAFAPMGWGNDPQGSLHQANLGGSSSWARPVCQTLTRSPKIPALSSLWSGEEAKALAPSPRAALGSHTSEQKPCRFAPGTGAKALGPGGARHILGTG